MHVLSIAGSDPSSGAGIQGDIKTCSALGAYGLCVVTAITSQNTLKFSKVQQVSADMVKSQIDSVLSDFKIDAIKIGMVYSSSVIKVIYSKLAKTKIPIILDPVFESTTCGTLLQKDAFLDFKKLLVPLAHVITPNILEAERLTGTKIHNKSDVRRALKKIQGIGAKNVIIKGGHLKGKTVTDFVLENSKFYEFSDRRIPVTNHGGGCGFSAALAVNIAKGKSLKESVKFAKEFVEESIRKSQKIGKGVHIVKAENPDKIETDLADAVSVFSNIKDIYTFIPECQTNFVFSKPNPRSLNDIIGVSGRIVKAGKSIVVAGDLKYGGSRHVGSAVLEAAKRFPKIRSALNIKYDQKIIRKATSKKLSVLSYDRDIEPLKTKIKEGSTISWGIQSAIKNSKKIPDVIFHKGDVGKEAMILIFGTNPKDVLAKLDKIVR